MSVQSQSSPIDKAPPRPRVTVGSGDENDSVIFSKRTNLKLSLRIELFQKIYLEFSFIFSVTLDFQQQYKDLLCKL